MIPQQIKHCIPSNADIALDQLRLDRVVKFSRPTLGQILADFIYQFQYNRLFYGLCILTPTCIVKCMTCYTKQLAQPFNPDLRVSIF